MSTIETLGNLLSSVSALTTPVYEHTHDLPQLGFIASSLPHRLLDRLCGIPSLFVLARWLHRRHLRWHVIFTPAAYREASWAVEHREGRLRACSGKGCPRTKAQFCANMGQKAAKTCTAIE